MAIHVKTRGKWKPVKIDPNIFAQHDMEDFICLEELTDYDVIRDCADNRSKSTPFKDEKSSKVKKEKKKTPSPVDKSLKAAKESADRVASSAKEGADRPKKKKRQKTKSRLKKSKDHTSENVPGESTPHDSVDRSKQPVNMAKARAVGDCIDTVRVSRKRKGKVVEARDITQLDDVDEMDIKDIHEARVHTKRTHQDAVDMVEGNTGPVKKKSKKAKERGSELRAECVVKGTVSPDKNACTTQVAADKNKLEMAGQPDMSSWADLFVPAPVLLALGDQGFLNPTPIQALALPSAIRDKKDIMGAAETGSGKTLAFAIPLIHHILRHLEQQRNKLAVHDDAEDDDADAEDDDDAGRETRRETTDDDGLSDTSDTDFTDSDTSDISSLEEVEVPSSPEMESKMDLDSQVAKASEKPLLALVLTPTRELAIQVKNHIEAASFHTNIRTVVVVGGMAPEKQKRLLRKQPEIVVATPGRLWELQQEGDPHLAKVADVKYLVIDEADRMVEKGHFAELSHLLALINQNERQRRKRQNFVFSATLTMAHPDPKRLMWKKKKKKTKMTERQKLECLMSEIGMHEKPKVIDLTRTSGTAATLSEARINCGLQEKDYYLYYFLQQYPGRTLVFTNSKDCIRRLVSVLVLLQCCPLPLHADMHQRQRLKNLDRFKGNPRGLLICTDVAARGLDIPDVKHVIHYQVPRTIENYVHRSGRTARASKEGLSIMLVSPEDLQNYRKIIKALNREEDIALFPVEQEYFTMIKARVNLTRQIDTQEHRLSKAKRENLWFQRTADEMEIELDEDQFLNDLGDKGDQAIQKQKLEYLRAELKALLNQPLARQKFVGRYLTKDGQLTLPFMKESTEGAIHQLKHDQKKYRHLHQTARKTRVKTLDKQKHKMKKRKQKNVK